MHESGKILKNRSGLGNLDRSQADFFLVGGGGVTESPTQVEFTLLEKLKKFRYASTVSLFFNKEILTVKIRKNLKKKFEYVHRKSSPKCGTLTWWGGLSGLIKY